VLSADVRGLRFGVGGRLQGGNAPCIRRNARTYTSSGGVVFCHVPGGGGAGRTLAAAHWERRRTSGWARPTCSRYGEICCGASRHGSPISSRWNAVRAAPNAEADRVSHPGPLRCLRTRRRPPRGGWSRRSRDPDMRNGGWNRRRRKGRRYRASGSHRVGVASGHGRRFSLDSRSNPSASTCRRSISPGEATGGGAFRTSCMGERAGDRAQARVAAVRSARAHSHRERGRTGQPGCHDGEVRSVRSSNRVQRWDHRRGPPVRSARDLGSGRSLSSRGHDRLC
jgi:hypothetical protein